jgi:hypothetical protein
MFVTPRPRIPVGEVGRAWRSIRDGFEAYVSSSSYSSQVPGVAPARL